MDFNANTKAAQVGNQNSFLPSFLLCFVNSSSEGVLQCQGQRVGQGINPRRKEASQKPRISRTALPQQWRNGRVGSLLQYTHPRSHLPGPNLILVSVDKTLLAEVGTDNKLDLSLGFS